MNSLKKYIKKRFPSFFSLFRSGYLLYNNSKRIKNFYKTNYKKNALLTYITVPFIKDSFVHTNYFEAKSWAKILSELGYNIDVVNYEYNSELDLSKYDIICGFGNVFQKYFEGSYNKKIKTIYYGTGMHVCHQNHATLQRIKNVYDHKGIWLGKSARFVEKTWTHQTSLVDGIIALGNDKCADSFKKYYEGKVLAVPAPFYHIHNAEELINQRSVEANKNFLWFGSSGLIHKGLDLLLDYFSNNPDLTLHVCGPIDKEVDFVNVYRKELFENKNIITYGFLDINSETFVEILKKCSFVVFPSCSEGGSPSVLTVVGNGGLIPIISHETTVSTANEIWIEKLTYEGIEQSIKMAISLDGATIKKMQIDNYEFVKEHNSTSNYYNELKSAITSLVVGS
ncbi:glycosyltransferase involved in cell wall biosynthesis [Flavobacterium nitrogenifigens]|uniref:Glycosyltransferase involved in cell wall biosynthesis n=2 Tax=Flavobacterium TaxID=237 RepID=A0A7W7J069_9FLAO|nr:MULTISPECIES: glycosyltransferase [Flavobacterium]MBB4803680.1 glycosyltransferase involved in cell wall biosynthesis [Flavobacterium nitrogenifigens]MBB6388515.1 glycosyltransferase involved in cell wall biosynthesis [Flavobacterium notoginsengisoli]